jgi:glycoside/pentoside/hexuronide:cation symporter, GPH family
VEPGLGVPPLTRRTKLAYAGGEFAGAGLYTVVNTWLLYYLVNAVGLRPLQAGAAFLVGRVLDAVLDPVMGELSDRLVHRVPRIRWIRFGAIPLALSFVLLWWLPSLGGPAFLLAVGSFVLFSAAFTVVAIPYQTLTPVLAPGYDARTSLTAYRMAMATFTGMVAVAAPPLIVSSLSGEAELAAAPASGWVGVGAVFALLAALSLVGLLRGIRDPHGTTASASAEEVVAPAGEVAAAAEVAAPAGEVAAPALEPLRIGTVTSALRQPLVRVVIAITMVASAGTMLANSLLPFFLESVLGLDAGEQTLAFGGLFAIAIASTPVWVKVSERWGKGRALGVGVLVHGSGLLLLAGLQPGSDEGALLLALLVPAGIGLAAIIVLPWAITPDAIEFDALAEGRRRDGSIYALNSLGQKVASSVGVFGSATVAAVFGYEAGQATQSAETVRGLAIAAGPVVAAIHLGTLAFVRRLPSREEHLAATAELAARGIPGPDGVTPTVADPGS